MDNPLPTRQRVTPEIPARIVQLTGTLSGDQQKVNVTVKLDLDSTHPDLELILSDAKGMELCRSTIIENIGAQISFTLHIRRAEVDQPLTLKCTVSYEEDQISSEEQTKVNQSD